MSRVQDVTGTTGVCHDICSMFALKESIEVDQACIGGNLYCINVQFFYKRRKAGVRNGRREFRVGNRVSNGNGVEEYRCRVSNGVIGGGRPL